MKFGENLQSHITHEWRTQYIDYERLKNELYQYKEEAPAEDSVEQNEIERYLQQCSEQFFQELEKELQKINLFFGEKLNEAARRFTQLKSDVEFHQKAEEKAKAKQTPKQQKQQHHQHQGNSPKENDKSSSVRKRLSGGGGASGVSPAKFLKIGAKMDKHSIKTIKELKLACTESYLNLVLIQNYQEINFTGFRKILKKHDKLMESTSGAEWRERHVETAPFHNNKQILQFITQTESIFINDLEHGDRSKAMKRLRVPPLDQKSKDYPRGVVFRVGLFTGMCLISLIAVALSIKYNSLNATPTEVVTAIKLYRPGFLIWLFTLFIGVNIWGWRTAGVNHVLIFEIDPREHLSHQHVLEITAWLALLWLWSILGFIYQPFSSIIPQYAHPLIFYSFCGLFMLNPVKIPGLQSYFKARMWLLRRGWRLIVAGYYPVEFADFWLADQLNSLAAVILDLEYMSCFFRIDGGLNGPNEDTITTALDIDGRVENVTATNATRGGDQPLERMEFMNTCGHSYLRILLACYPALIRFLQCLRRYYDSQKTFPHLWNAGKYSTTFFKIIFQALWRSTASSMWFSLWTVSTVISSFYTLTWDLKMDWGFLESGVENKYLRDEIVYQYPIYYYLAIMGDILLRFAWGLEFYLSHYVIKSTIVIEIVSTTFKSLEVFRRFVWNFFRLENEHLNNCGEFRAVRDISINPLREDDLATLIKMMDAEGFSNFNRSTKRSSDGGGAGPSA